MNMFNNFGAMFGRPGKDINPVMQNKETNIESSKKFDLKDFDIEKFNIGNTKDEIINTIQTLKNTYPQDYEQGIVFYQILDAIQEKIKFVPKEDLNIYTNILDDKTTGDLYGRWPAAFNDVTTGKY